MQIYQLTNCTFVQMMGYIIKTDNGKVIVIDGGGYGQSPELYRVLKQVGDHVDMWFLTHSHNDHYASIMELFREHPEISVAGLWRSNCNTPEVVAAMSDAERRELKEWLCFEQETMVPLHTLHMWQKFSVDSVEIEVLGINNPEILENNSNNQSVVLKITEGDFSILFLGDLGIEGGEKLLKVAGDKVISTAVQMAHHGQRGVAKEVYEKIQATYAFWPTPIWLWNNTATLEDAFNTGPYDTRRTVGWMEALGTINITSFSNSVVFDTKTKTVEIV